MFAGALGESILARAQEKGILRVALHNIRDYTTDRHNVCDGYPYGGGGGMIMKPEPIFRAVETVLQRPAGWQLPPQAAHTALPNWSADEPAPLPSDVPVILLTPQGRRFDQQVAQELSEHTRLALLCGRYEGVDERVRTHLVTDELSIGDFVLSGGEPAALIVMDAVTRLLPGVLGAASGAAQDSYSAGKTGLLEGPQYTRPPSFRGHSVPDVLLSGHHANVERWHRQQSLLRTLARRPDLLADANAAGLLTTDDLAFLAGHGWQPAPGSVTKSATETP